jgi:hypothetical protein
MLEKPMGESGIYHSEKQATLYTRHRTKTNKAKSTTLKTKGMTHTDPNNSFA